MHRPGSKTKVLCVGVLLSGALAGRVSAQVAPAVSSPASASSSQPATSGGASEAVFVDRNFGYTLIPPLGFVGNSAKVPGPGGSLRLTQFVATHHDAWLRVRYSQAQKNFTKEELLEGLRIELLSVRLGAKLRFAKLRTVAGRPAAIGEIEFKVDDRRVLRFQAAIQSRPDEVFMLVFQADAEAFENPRDLFEHTVNSFALPELVVSRDALGECFTRGMGWLASIASRNWTDKLVPVAYWKLERKGKPSGFLRMHEEPAQDEGTSGVRIRERAWLFGEDRSYRDVGNSIFLSFDLRTETWENLVQVRSEVDGNPTVLHDLHKSLRGDDKLLMMFTERPGDLALSHDSLQVPKTYIPMGLLRLFPRLVDLTKPRTYAFTAYDVESKQLMIRILKVLGPMRDPRIRLTGPVFEIEDTVGLLGPPTRIFTDEKGNILKVFSGEIEMTASSREKIEATFKTQMAWADDLYQRTIQLQQQAAIEQLRKSADFGKRSRRSKR